MEDFRSKSCGDGRNYQIESYNGGGGGGGGKQAPSSSSGMSDLRCYSASYTSSVPPQTQIGNGNGNGNGNKDMKLKKGKGGGSSSKSWSFNDPELQRKKRVASYKVYAVEGKMKGSIRKSVRWLKDRYTQVVYGWW